MQQLGVPLPGETSYNEYGKSDRDTLINEFGMKCDDAHKHKRENSICILSLRVVGTSFKVFGNTGNYCKHIKNYTQIYIDSRTNDTQEE